MICVVRVEAMAFGGAGVGRLPTGKVAFVRGGLPGELVKARVWREKNSLVEVEVEAVSEPSPQRVTPRCPVADQCGGCGWMHLAEESQRDWKHRLLGAELERAGLPAGPETLSPPLSGDSFGFRTRTRLHRRGDSFGTLAFRSHAVVSLTRCPILHPDLEAFAQALAGALRDLPPAAPRQF